VWFGILATKVWVPQVPFLGLEKLQIHAVAALGPRQVFDSAALKTTAGPSTPLRYAQDDRGFGVVLEGKNWKLFDLAAI
jgi:hypothetical protein